MKVRRQLIILAVLLVLILLYLPILSPELGLLFSRVPFAWMAYLWRTLPNVEFNWSGIGMVVLCSAIALALGHSFRKWLYRQIGGSAPAKGLPGIWPVRWTFALYGGFWLLFAIVMTASGLARTTTWFFQFDKPFYVARSGNSYIAEMKQIEGMVALAALECKGDVSRMREWMFEFGQDYRPPPWEKHEFLFFPAPDNILEAAIFYPRDIEAQRRVGFWMYGAGEKEHPIDKLTEVIARLERTARERAGAGYRRG